MSFIEIQTKKGTYVVNSAFVIYFQPAPGGYQYGGIITMQNGAHKEELELRTEEADKFRKWLLAK